MLVYNMNLYVTQTQQAGPLIYIASTEKRIPSGEKVIHKRVHSGRHHTPPMVTLVPQIHMGKSSRKRTTIDFIFFPSKNLSKALGFTNQSLVHKGILQRERRGNVKEGDPSSCPKSGLKEYSLLRHLWKWRKKR